ncbi:chorion peroxidase isoform X2 [Aethina tumida]|uniref:chorion peroxidase isoform X2 n=1 Tax=Aethina tumida TaxID=116153 RepID=UPI0021479072|nr:chorion peroxidase isoform X2 [Aethina tumida]
MEEQSEKTFLLPHNDTPKYVFSVGSSSPRVYQLRKFQCCISTICLSIFLAVFVGAIVYILNLPPSESPEIPTNSTTDSTSIENNLIFLLAQQFPVEDRNMTTINDNNSKNSEIDEIINSSLKALQNKDNNEKNILSLPLKSPGHRHQMATSTGQRARNISRIGFIEDHATKLLLKMHPSWKSNKIYYNTTNTIITNFCKKAEMNCNPYQKYRSYDGSCNNLKYPGQFGVSFQPFRRALPPEYDDGINSPRGSELVKLPSARTISLVVHRPYYRSDRKFSVLLAVWGQFLDHDITATALSQKSDGSSISCCQNSNYKSPECFPVKLDDGDPFLEYNISCIEFVRSAAAPKCYLGPREQINQVSSYIDGSVVYSADEKTVKSLRTLEKGILKMYVTNENRTLLPISEDMNDGCNREEQRKNGRYCFLTGDARANENLHLTSMHLIWARNHNLIARKLSTVNPNWNDETLFQESRKILSAQMQHITYNEFLPILLGPRIMQKFELSPKDNGYFKKYNESMDPSIANSFAAAAFRFAHSIIPGLMKLLANDTSSPDYISTHQMLFDPFKLYDSETLDKTIRGAMNTSIEATDSYFTNELKQRMFEKPDEVRKNPKMCGLDLVSLNIQRGRDHGLPPYIKWRNHCGLRQVTNFDELKSDFFTDSWYNVKSIYKSVDDIDLYTGALSEIPLEESILGPTLTCLILDQFNNNLGKYEKLAWQASYAIIRIT